MYPNPQDVLPLPPHPDLDQYRKRAKELASSCRSGEAALMAWAGQWIEALTRLQPDQFRLSPNDAGRRAHQVATFAHQRMSKADCSLSQAQFVIARAHGFESWTRLVEHIDGLDRSDSAVASFERAADAVVQGDLAGLTRLIEAEPALVRARSSREHRSTLLHYTSANGVEHYRQRTPANIEAIQRYLLDAGAEVDAVAEVYGGLTTFALVVTSAHPRAAGVQNALADLLLSRGARMDKRIVHYCLVNGCPEAAAHLADKGAPVDVVSAAGIGRLDVIRTAFAAPTKPSAIEQAQAMVMAAWARQHDAAALLLEFGVDPGVSRPEDRQTALHIACYQGDLPLASLMLRHHAPLNVTDGVYGTPPMVWAMHGWLVENRPDATPYVAILRALVAAGAEVKREWLTDQRLRAEPALYEALARAAG